MNVSSLIKAGVVLFTLWLAVQIMLWLTGGIYTGGEALRFTHEAELWIKGEPFSSKAFWLYLTEIFLLASATTLKIGYAPVVVIHLLINLAATATFFYLSVQKLKSLRLAIIATALLILYLPYQLYNTFLYTESIFFSLLILLSAAILTSEQISIKKTVWVAFLLLCMCITRPTGIFVLTGVAIYLLIQWKAKSPQIKWLVFFLLFVFLSAAVNMLLLTGDGINGLAPFTGGYVICDVQGATTHLDLSNSQQPLYALMYYITHNPAHFAILALKKTAAFFGLYRSWYSPWHNIAQMTLFFILYALTLYAARKNKNRHVILFTGCITFVFWMFVIFSCDEWHNRFFLTLTPLFILSGMSAFKKKDIKTET